MDFQKLYTRGQMDRYGTRSHLAIGYDNSRRKICSKKDSACCWITWMSLITCLTLASLSTGSDSATRRARFEVGGKGLCDWEGKRPSPNWSNLGSFYCSLTQARLDQSLNLAPLVWLPDIHDCYDQNDHNDSHTRLKCYYPSPIRLRKITAREK